MSLLIPTSASKFVHNNVWYAHQSKRPVVRARPSLVKNTPHINYSFVHSPYLREASARDQSTVCGAEQADRGPFISSLQRQLRNVPFHWREVIPMCSLFFFMAFINTIINNLSLSMVMTASGGGAVVIPYLTAYAVLPISVAFTVVYAFAAHHISRDRLFNIVIISFALSLSLFCFVLYPNHHSLHLNSLAETLTKVLPSGLEGGIGMIKNWTFTLFYCISELWGDVGLSLLFWGFANDITHVDSAPLLYPLFGIGANLAQTLGGLVLRHSSSSCFAATFKSLTFQMLGCMAIVLALHQWISKQAKTKEKKESTIQTQWKSLQQMRLSRNGRPKIPSNGHVKFVSWREPQLKTKTKKKERKSFKESLKMLSECPQIRCLGIMTIAQGLAVTLMEFLWKCHLKFAYPTPEAFTAFLGDISTATGIVTVVLMCLSPFLFSRLKWGEVANLTPRLLTWGGVVFFGACITFHLAPKLGFMSLSSAMILPIIFGGSCLFVIARGAKFSLFKPAEEMVYITLNEESRTKGKAAVDVVGAQIGKAGGSIMQQVLLMISGGRLLGITPIMVMFYFYMLKIWKEAVAEIDARRFISQQTRDLTSDQELEPNEEFRVPVSLS